jgi:hypothetical protein
MYTKIHHSYRNVFAVCDSNLIGKKFEEGKMQLEVRENFFKEKESSYEEVVSMMKMQLKDYATFNIVGEESVKAALEAGIICQEGIGKIQNIPFALVLF